MFQMSTIKGLKFQNCFDYYDDIDGIGHENDVGDGSGSARIVWRLCLDNFSKHSRLSLYTIRVISSPGQTACSGRRRLNNLT